MKSGNPQSPLPKSWPTHVRAAILHVISLAQFATAYTRSWSANRINSRIRLTAQRDRAVQELALLREETRIKDADLRAEVGISCQALAYLLPEERSDEAEELLREAIRLGEDLVSESPENPRYEHKLAQCYRTLGDRLTDDDPEQAELYLVEAASTFGRLGTNFPGNAQYHRFHAFSLAPWAASWLW